jgi:hypothetical protein
MDPVTLIVAALATGVLKGVGESASAAVQDAYTRLRAAVTDRFSSKPAAQVVLAEHADDPDTYAKPLEKHVRDAHLGDDPRIVELAQTLMWLLDHDGTRAGKYTVHLDGAKGVQVGDQNTQTNTFS